MKLFSAIALLAAGLFFSTSCEQHEWEQTKKFHKPHGGHHGDEGDHGHGKDDEKKDEKAQ